MAEAEAAMVGEMVVVVKTVVMEAAARVAAARGCASAPATVSKMSRPGRAAQFHPQR
tara:strand:- start:461 stop:631 length:171 start_codon:yes stop_codon:yes gene_type:complete